MLVARLSAPTLELDAAPDFAWGETEGLDLDLSLEAQTVRSTRGGQLSGDGGRIVAHLLRAGEAMRLERLDMRNIGGADLTASAAWGKGGAGLQGEARLKAGDLAPLAQVFSRLWPGAAAKAVAARAKSLSPADLACKAADGAYTLNGTLGATRIAASVAPGTGGAARRFGRSRGAGGRPAAQPARVADGLGAEARTGARLRPRPAGCAASGRAKCHGFR